MFKSSQNIREKETHKKRRGGYKIETENYGKRKWRDGVKLESGCSFQEKDEGQDEVEREDRTGPHRCLIPFLLSAVSPACLTSKNSWDSKTTTTNTSNTPWVSLACISAATRSSRSPLRAGAWSHSSLDSDQLALGQSQFNSNETVAAH